MKGYFYEILKKYCVKLHNNCIQLWKFCVIFMKFHILQKLALKKRTQIETRSLQWLTLSTSDQWEVVGQSHLPCICEL